MLDDAPFKGRKRYECGIELRRNVAQTDARWRTLIHEMLHAHSNGLTATAYNQHIGWEEGPVEGLQRLLRRQILAELGVFIDEEVFILDEAEFPFEQHVIDMGTLYQARKTLTGWEQAEPEGMTNFLFDMLNKPLAERSANFLSWARLNPIEKSRPFIAAYSSVSRRLNGV